MAEMGWRRGRADSGRRIGLPARLGSGELSLTDPMGPLPSVVRVRGDWPEVTPDRLGLSRERASIQSTRMPDRTHPLQAGKHREILDSDSLQESLLAWAEFLGGLPEPTGHRASPRLCQTAPDKWDPDLAEERNHVSIRVPGEGVEPSWSYAPRDFESRASTSFTTPAGRTTPFYGRPTGLSSRRVAQRAERLGDSGAGARRDRGQLSAPPARLSGLPRGFFP